MPTAIGTIAESARPSAEWTRLVHQNQLDEAATVLRQYLRVAPLDVEALHDLGVVHARRRQFPEAVKLLQEAVNVDPSRAEHWKTLARALGDLERYSESAECLRKVVELQPDLPANHQALGQALKKAQNLEGAITALEKACALEADSADRWHELGIALGEAKHRDEAKKAYLRALELKADNYDTLNNLGVLCQDMGQLDEAVGYLQTAIKCRPGVAGAYNNLGVALAEQRKFDPAIDAYNKALAIAPDFAIAWNNIGNSLRSVGKVQASIAAIQKCVAIKPDYPEAYNNLAIAYVQKGDHFNAVRFYNKAMWFRPDYPEGHMNRGLELLSGGDLENGWADYEWRWRLKGHHIPNFNARPWDGGPLLGKRILLFHEQGLGDTIQFVRYAAELKHRGATVIVSAQPPLQRILSRTPGIDEFIPAGQPLPAFDCHAALLSVPGLLKTRVDCIPAATPYIFCDPQLNSAWKSRIEALNGFKVGIVWQGNPDHRGDHIRSVKLRQFESIAKIPGVHLVSLQRGFGTEQIAENSHSFAVTTFDGIDDKGDGFERTAAIIKNLDLLITIDTAVAHLAGAMGAPVWLAIPLAADWRWLQVREDSPWYPTMRLFRQQQIGEWNDVFARLATALKSLVENSISHRNIAEETRQQARELARLGTQCLTKNDVSGAEKLLKEATQLDPTCSDAYHDLGVALARLRRLDEAIGCFRRCMELKPDALGVLGNLGLALLEMGQVEESVETLRQAIRSGIASADVHNNLGVSLSRIPDSNGAIGSFRNAIQIRPDYAGAHFNLARGLLLEGHHEHGWLEYEWRKEVLPGQKREFRTPRWTGTPLGSQTILLYTEQGLGDSIQFVRYAALVKRQFGGKVLLQCQSELVSMLSRVDGVDEVVGSDCALPHHDCHAALMSLPALLGTTLKTVPAAMPYLAADPELVNRWKSELDGVHGFKVGIAWQGNPHFEGDSYRSIPLHCFRSLSRVPGVRLISLQQNAGREQLAANRQQMSVVDFGAAVDREHGAFMDTAAIIHELDLIITSDSAIAHLAGALGAPVWVALGTSPDFRWMQAREDCPWYPSMRLFRQSRRGDWEELFERIAHALKQHAAAHPQPVGDPSPAHARLLHAEALQRLGRGELAEAADYLRQVIELEPDWPDAHHDLGVTLARQRQFKPAIEHMRRALQLKPDLRAVFGNLSLALIEAKDYLGAVVECRALLQRAPDSTELYVRLATALIALSRYAEAIEAAKSAIRLQPAHAEAHCILANAQRESGDPNAIASYLAALRLRPDWVEAWNLLGMTHAAFSQHAEAVEAYRHGLEVKPDSVDINNNLAVSLADLGRLDDAVVAFENSLSLQPDNAGTHRNLALTLLLRGDYDRGWLEYEWRFKADNSRHRNLPGKRWDGCALNGQRLLIVAEQGLGDTLQFARYGYLAKEHGAAQVILECQPPLVPLLSMCPFIDDVVAQGQALPPCDFHVQTFTLPVGFNTTVQTIPTKFPYLSAKPALSEGWRRLLGEDDVFRIGICWQGSRSYGGDRHRSIPLRFFAPLASLGGVELVSLQRGFGAEQLADVDFPVRQLEGLDDHGGAFMDTAAVLMHLDLIVCSDTAVVHLAGALGRPVYLALSAACDWRWMRARGDSPWYPTLKLFRQERAGEWESVFQQIGAAVQEKVDKTHLEVMSS